MSEATTIDVNVLRSMPLPEYKEDASKADYGKLLIIAGSARLPGAANEATPLVALSAYHESDAQGDTLFAAKFEKPITAARLRTALQLFG